MVYNDYYAAYQAGQFDIRNVNFITKLMYETYIPESTHKPNNSAVKKHVVVTAGSLKGDPLTTKPMSEIIQIMKSKIKEDIESDPAAFFEEIDALFADDIEKSMQMKNAFSDFAIEDYKYWENLKNLGVKYVLVQSPNLHICCFCEEIM